MCVQVCVHIFVLSNNILCRLDSVSDIAKHIREKWIPSEIVQAPHNNRKIYTAQKDWHCYRRLKHKLLKKGSFFESDTAASWNWNPGWSDSNVWPLSIISYTFLDLTVGNGKVMAQRNTICLVNSWAEKKGKPHELGVEPRDSFYGVFFFFFPLLSLSIPYLFFSLSYLLSYLYLTFSFLLVPKDEKNNFPYPHLLEQRSIEWQQQQGLCGDEGWCVFCVSYRLARE